MKHKPITYLLALLLSILFISCSDDKNSKPDFLSEGDFEGSYFPTTEWRYCAPEEVGIDSKKLIEAHKQISNPDIATQAYLVIKDGYIVAEDYFRGFNPGDKHSSYSIAKSFTSAVIGIAIDKGFINSENDLISEYYTQLNSPETQEWKKELTIAHLLTMTSGLDWNESGYAENDLVQMRLSSNHIDYVLSKDLVNQPGTIFSYNSGESMLLSGIINLTTGKSMLEFATEHMFEHIGIEGLDWDSDSENHTLAGWGIDASMENYARFGYLFLNNGNWDGNQLISEEWISKSTTPFREQSPFYGYMWWLNDEAFFQSNIQLPEDSYMAIGAFGQYIIILPSHNMVIVRVGVDSDAYTWKADEFINLVIASVDTQ